jgi:small ligand-binding sensory domain FIST
VPFASAMSQHPEAAAAVGEVVGRVLEDLGPEPDLAILFVSAAHVGAVADIAAVVRRVVSPRVLLGCTAGSVVGDAHEVEDAPAVSLWAGRMPTVVPFRLDATRPFPAAEQLPADAAAFVLLADPFTYDAADAVASSALPVIGGLASAGMRPGFDRLVLDGEVFTDGAVAVAIGGVDVTTVVSQGCRPVGQPMVVTAGEGNLLAELGGRRALDRLQDELASLDESDLVLARLGLHMGRVIDEQREEFDRGDFLVRNVLGGDPERGVVAVGDEVTVGGTVQLHVRDAITADEDLRLLLEGQQADGALLFTCNGRGTHLFGIADHDALVADAALDGAPIAGMSCQGEIGPVGGRSFLHGFTASLLLLRDR